MRRENAIVKLIQYLFLYKVGEIDQPLGKMYRETKEKGTMLC